MSKKEELTVVMVLFISLTVLIFTYLICLFTYVLRNIYYFGIILFNDTKIIYSKLLEIIRKEK